MSYYIIESGSGGYFATIEPIEEPGNDRERAFPVSFAWTASKGEAVRFTSKYHAAAVASLIGATYHEVES